MRILCDSHTVTGICRRRKAELIKESLGSNDVDLPTCDEEGNYAPKQCKSDGKECWCVEKNGREIPDSRVILKKYQRLSCG